MSILYRQKKCVPIKSGESTKQSKKQKHNHKQSHYDRNHIQVSFHDFLFTLMNFLSRVFPFECISAGKYPQQHYFQQIFLKSYNSVIGQNLNVKDANAKHLIYFIGIKKKKSVIVCEFTKKLKL